MCVLGLMIVKTLCIYMYMYMYNVLKKATLTVCKYYTCVFCCTLPANTYMYVYTCISANVLLR